MADLKYEHRMSDSDALMWSIERNPLLRSTITTLILLDGTFDRAELMEKFERATRVIPRLRQRVVSNPYSLAPPRWERDPNYDLAFHIRWNKAASVTGENEPTTADLLRAAEPIAMQGFDRARPLWECHVFEGVNGDQTAIAMKIHHAITDGVGGMRLMLEIFDLDPDEKSTGLLPPLPAPHVMSQRERFLDATVYEGVRRTNAATEVVGGLFGFARRALKSPVEEVTRVAATATSLAHFLKPATEPLSPVMTERSLSSRFAVVTVPLDATKAAAKAAGCTLNDAFVAGLLGGFARYHERLGRPPEELRMAMPVSIRNEDTADSAGNQFTPTRFAVPAAIADPADRMRAIHELVQHELAEPALALTEPFAAVLNQLPSSAVVQIFGQMLTGIDFTSSNVPGAPIPVYLCGTEMVGMYAFGPLSGAAVNATLLSYRNDLNIGLNMDPAAVADPAQLATDIEAGFEEVLAVG